MMILSVQMLRRCSLKNAFFLLHCSEEKYHVIAVDGTLEEYLTMLPASSCHFSFLVFYLHSVCCDGDSDGFVLLVHLMIKCYGKVKLSLSLALLMCLIISHHFMIGQTHTEKIELLVSLSTEWTKRKEKKRRAIEWCITFQRLTNVSIINTRR